jgi:hypothetical protein
MKSCRFTTSSDRDIGVLDTLSQAGDRFTQLLQQLVGR